MGWKAVMKDSVYENRISSIIEIITKTLIDKEPHHINTLLLPLFIKN